MEHQMRRKGSPSGSGLLILDPVIRIMMLAIDAIRTSRGNSVVSLIGVI